MNPTIILVGGEKGGTGKTTIATNLATLRARAGRDVLLIDTDAQGSAAMWAQVRAEEGARPTITCVQVHGKGVAAEVRKLAPRFDDVVIDSGGRDSIELRQAMLVANVMVIPARPSQFDLHGIVATDRVVSDAKGFNASLRALVVINCATAHATSTDALDMAAVIRDIPGLTLARSVIKDRVSFRRAARDGLCVAEYLPQDNSAIDEMEQLYRETFG